MLRHSAYEPHRVCSVRQARTVHYGRAFFGRGEGERQLVPLHFWFGKQADTIGTRGHAFPPQPAASSTPSPSSMWRSSSSRLAREPSSHTQPPPMPCLAFLTRPHPVSLADIRSSTRSFSCSPRSRVLLLKLSCCLRPLVVTFAVTARSPRGHGGCSSRAPSPAGAMASTGSTAGCAARDQTTVCRL